MNICKANFSETQHTPTWILDSGASHHVSGDKSLFHDTQACTSTSPSIAAGGEPHRVAGKGNVNVTLSGGKFNQFKNVLYVPSICGNLLSVGRITNDGFYVKFHNQGVIIQDKTIKEVKL